MIPLSKKDEENEHSLEMHLPYILKIFGSQKFKLVPLMVGQTKPKDLSHFAKVLSPLFLDPGTLFIISSDFCHWGEDFDYQPLYKDIKSIHKSIEKLDQQGMSLIEAHDL